MTATKTKKQADPAPAEPSVGTPWKVHRWHSTPGYGVELTLRPDGDGGADRIAKQTTLGAGAEVQRQLEAARAEFLRDSPEAKELQSLRDRLREQKEKMEDNAHALTLARREREAALRSGADPSGAEARIRELTAAEPVVRQRVEDLTTMVAQAEATARAALQARLREAAAAVHERAVADEREAKEALARAIAAPLVVLRRADAVRQTSAHVEPLVSRLGVV
jgi:hypothetical protein